LTVSQPQRPLLPTPPVSFTLIKQKNSYSIFS